MPRIKALFTGTVSYGRATRRLYHQPITKDVYADMASAVDGSHPCTDPSCDISRANSLGYTAVATRMFFDATEADDVRAVLDAHRFNRSREYEEFIEQMRFQSTEDNDWYEWFMSHHVACPGCGACITYEEPEEISDECPNCRGPVPAVL